MSIRSHHVSVRIDRPAREVYDFAADPEHLVEWAAGLGAARREQDEWVVDGPVGRVTVRFAPANDLGVLDHEVTLPTGETTYNPLRVVPDGSGSEVVFSVRQADGTSDADFERDVAAVTADLRTLQQLLEPPRTVADGS